MMKKFLAAACAACLTLPVAAFDISDYAAVYRIYLADYLQKMDDFRVPNAHLRAFMDVGIKNSCDVGYSSTAIDVSTNEMDFNLGAGGHYSAIYETFQVSAQQCEILHTCSDSDTTCRASYRACMASAISAERVNDLGDETLTDLVANYKQSNVGQFAQDFDSASYSGDGIELDFSSLETDMAYVDAYGERPGYTALDSAATIIATVKSGLIAAGHDSNLVDDAFENGLPQDLDADTPEEDLRYNGLGSGDFQDICYVYRTYLDEFVSTLNDLALAYGPMAATRAAYRAATEVYLANSSCAILPNDGAWDYTDWINDND